jgi:nucleoside-diphosphate-sugar epimerase
MLANKLGAITSRTTNSSRHFSKQLKTVRPWAETKILVAGCQGQIGVPLVKALAKELGADRVIATDLDAQKFDFPCKFEQLDICDGEKYRKLVDDHKVDYIVHLAGILSALGEKKPDLAIDVNVFGAINALRIAREKNC